MEDNNENKPTRLILFSDFYNRSDSIRERLTSLPTLINSLDYKFQYEMPSVEAYTIPTKTEKYINWRGKEKERIIYNKNRYQHLLVFSKKLSEEELKFWRIFKLGYLCMYCTPEVRGNL